MSSPLSTEQLHVFHAQERAIFSKLVMNFSRPPFESLLVIATWLWLEDFGFENIFSIILALPDPLLAALSYEAVSCFRCLDSSDPRNGFYKIPLTKKYLKGNMSLQLIQQNRYSATIGIKNFLNTVCSRIFSDILQRVLPSSSSTSFGTRFRQPLSIPGFPHPIFGSINVMIDEVRGFFIPHGLWGWNANCIATESDRTLFLTFSRGFPVSHIEVIELFTKEFGEDCVEGVYMQQDNPNAYNANVNSSRQQQSLYARLLLDSVATVDRILNGTHKKSFLMYGKHIWARKYEKRGKPT
ncbi:hypothetical protein CARUB_v10017740mg [Capsella rubella]|uniref:Uncharacterized protein n=1 Tax=Capsella rubella TaxID=81985 RepID=R0HKV0_9BRAS|nr:uncharacterized protein LOC17886122 [Capsella rubella]EOA24483.1 hypothetical protein CARUB_v10017740mg [Capsella rubella]